MTGTSFSERKLSALLDAADMIYEQEYIFPDLKSEKGNPLRFDFAVFEDIEHQEARLPKFLVELNGEQHYKQKFQTREQFAKQQANDKRKVNYCGAKGLVLVTIPYTEFNTMTLDDILDKGHYFD